MMSTTTSPLRVPIADEARLAALPITQRLLGTKNFYDQTPAPHVFAHTLLSHFAANAELPPRDATPDAIEWDKICNALIDPLDGIHGSSLHVSSPQYATFENLLPPVQKNVPRRTLSKLLTLYLPHSVWHSWWPQTHVDDVIDPILGQAICSYRETYPSLDANILSLCKSALSTAVLV